MASPSLMLKAARAGGGSPLPGPPALPQRPGRSPRLGNASLCPSQLQGRAPHRSGLLGEQLRHTPGVPPCPRLRETEGDRQVPYQSRRVGIRNGKPEQPCCSLKIHSSGIWKEEGGRGVPRVDSGLARGCPWPGQPSLCPAARRLSARCPPSERQPPSWRLPGSAARPPGGERHAARGGRCPGDGVFRIFFT